jgi:hypothetical protein
VVNNATIIQNFWRPAVQAYSDFIGAQWNYVPNSSVVNTFRFGFNYFRQSFETSDCGGAAGAPAYGLPFGYGGLNDDAKPNCGFTNITFSGSNGSVGCCSSFPKYYGPDHIKEFIDNVSVLHGNHTFKFGGEMRLSTLGATGTFNRGRGQVQFRSGGGNCSATAGFGGCFPGGTKSWNTLQNYMRGFMGTAGQIFIGDPRRNLSTQAYALFLQDDWRVTKNVMLNLGVRYEYVTPVKEKFGRLANFDPNSGLQQLGMQTDQMWHADTNNFAPRLGLAWDIRGNGKTVLRAGGNMIYVTPGLWNQVFQQNTNNPTTGLNGNATGYQICTGRVLNKNPDGTLNTADDACTPGPGNIVSSGIVLRQNNLVPVGSLPGATPCTTANNGGCVPGLPNAGEVNWNQNPGAYGGNIYPGVADAANVFKCSFDKQCTIQATNQNLKNAYVTSYSLGIQQAFTNNLSLQVDYVGNHATKLIGLEYTNTPGLGAGYCLNPDGSLFSAAQRLAVSNLSGILGGGACPSAIDASTVDNLNAIQVSRPLNGKFPYYSYIYTVSNPFTSNYNGMQVTLTQRAVHGLSYTLGFTWAHSLDEQTSERGGPNGIPRNKAADYSSSDFDINKRFTATVTYALPGKAGYFQLLSGWKLTSIVTLQSGLPWGVAGNRGDDPTGMGESASGSDDPNRWNFYGDPNSFSRRGVTPIPPFAGTSNPACLAKAQALDNSANPTGFQTLGTVALQHWGCFVSEDGKAIMIPPAIGSFGNMTRNMFRSPGIHLWDFSVLKDIRFTERFRGEFRWEVFNILNHTQYGNPQFNGAGGNLPVGGPGQFGASQQTPDVANNNPSLGSGGPREMQMGFRLTF